MKPPIDGGRAEPGRDAAGGGAAPLRRRPLDLNRLAMQPAGSPGFAVVERAEGRAALAVRIARLLVATMPAHLVSGPAVLWLSAAMAARGFTPAEIRTALPSAGIPIGRDRPGRRERAPQAGRRRAEPEKSNNPEVGGTS